LSTLSGFMWTSASKNISYHFISAPLGEWHLSTKMSDWVVFQTWKIPNTLNGTHWSKSG
jgi:hypothetical protein